MRTAHRSTLLFSLLRDFFTEASSMSVFPTKSPGFPAMRPLKGPVPWPFVDADRADLVPPPFIPIYNPPRVENPAAKERRKFFLQKSVFNLVDAHNQMALMDPRLLQWYLCLCPDDKNIINEEGGLHHFLQNHPGLKLFQDHTSVEYRFRHPAQSTMTSFQQTSQLAGPQKCICEDHWAYMGHGTKTVDGKAHFSCEGLSEEFSGIIGEDGNILVCLPSEDLKAHNGEVGSCPPTSIASELAAGSEIPKSDRQATSTMPRAPTCDAMVSTEPLQCTSAHTQTEVPETAEKHTSTELHMGDFDSLAENVMKLKVSQDCKEPKEKNKSWASKMRRNCDCMQRALRAELCLLALQYSVCRQHSWRLFYASAEGKQLSMMPQDPPANIVSILQELEFAYNEMKRQILMGVPLEQLKPLSVDLEKITAGARYTPAQVIGDLLGNISSWKKENLELQMRSFTQQRPLRHRTTSQEPPKHGAVEEKGCGDDESRTSCQVASHGGVFHHDQMQKKQMPAACGEGSSNETWFDAEEELQLPQPAADAEISRDPNSTDESPSDEADDPALPGTVTQSQAVHLFEKFQPSEVTLSASNKDSRVPTAAANHPQSDEAAARELNGQTRSRSSQEELLSSPSQASHVATAPQPSNPPSSSERKLVTLPPLSSRIGTKKVVCISPAAKETCVPQHFGTMGSIDILTDELMRRHPDVSRQRVVDALMELRAKHHGALSSLPLRTIRDMMSELLSRPADTTES